MNSQDVPVPSSVDEVRKDGFLVVGVGASAGGLKAFGALLEHLPADPGFALVLISHLAPAHESKLTEILQRRSRLPLVDITDGMHVEPNRAYVLQPATSLTFIQGRLHVVQAQPTVPQHDVVDQFLISLASELHERAIGVILSGSAGDGSAGIKAIRAEGGITFAQDETAEFRGMPLSAVSTGVVDFVLPPQGIAQEILRISQHPYPRLVQEQRTAADADSLGEESLKRVLQLLGHRTGVAFLHYKPSTVRRRIARRMAIRKFERLDDYLKDLESHPDEIRTLHDDILINVTSFFRDPESFDALKAEVFPRLLENRPPRSPIRIWVPGCASGEEPYSLAIALLEFLDEKGSQETIQIFASDLNESVLSRARLGIYKKSISEDMSEERLRKFFMPVEGERYRISKRVRDLCLFAKHDLTHDPPFSRIDLVSCRNLLIYLGPILQKRVIPLLHYAMKPAGFLMLGSSESVDRFDGLFTPVDRKQKIYSRVSASREEEFFDFPSDRLKLLEREPRTAGKDEPTPAYDLGKEVDRLLIRDHVPPSLVVNEGGAVVELRGDTSPYLRQSPGKPSPAMQKMVKPELIPDLESAIREAREKGVRVRRENVEHRIGEHLRKIAIEVRPVPSQGAQEHFFLVLFEEAEAPGPEAVKPAYRQPSAERAELEREVERLRHALDANREYQQSIIEKVEASNEELRSSHEEVLSSNEELQSTNEELETAKEELQSANEELKTLNEELHQRNTELGQSNSDLANVLSNVQIPIAIVDSDLRLRRVTPAGEKLLNVIPSDVNRRITDFKPNFNIQNLEELLRQAVDKLVSNEQEVQDAQGRWHSLRIRPYRSVENKIEGAVLTIVDIDGPKRAAIENERARAFSEAVIDSVPHAILVLNTEFRVERANDAFFSLFSVSREETENKLLSDIGGGRWDLPKLRPLLQRIIPENLKIEDFEAEYEIPGVGRKSIRLHARKLLSWHTRSPMILLVLEDATKRIHAEREVKSLNVALEGRVQERTSQLERSKSEMEAFTYSIAHDLRAPLRAMHGFAHLVLEDYKNKPLDKDAEEKLRRIIESSTRMDALIQDLLSYSRLTREGISDEPVELKPLVDEVLLEMAPEIKTRGAKVDVDALAGRVRGNRLALGRILVNLMSNALKFVAPGTVPHVRIRGERHNGSLRVWVEDNGIGIDPRFHERIFRVFERLNRPEEFPGTGIGLAVVKTAIEKLGGQVGLSSEPGKGSRFYVELPDAGSERASK